MTTEAAVTQIRHVAAARRPLVLNAGRVVAAGAALGIAGQLLFFDVALGINFPIAVVLLIAGGWATRRPAKIDVRDLWLAPAAVLFAGFAAIRADPRIVFLDVLTSITLAGAALAGVGGRPVVRQPLWTIIRLALGTIGWIVGGAAAALADARGVVPAGRSLAERMSRGLPVLRGVALAIPVVVLFVALFSSADAVFARVIDDLFGVHVDLDEAVWRGVMAAVLAWLIAGALAMTATEPMVHADTSASPSWRIGTTEVITVLVAVGAVFVLFVVLQGAYLFGGLDTLAASGISYADYARRGFFELVAVAILSGGLIVGGDRLARDRTRTLVVAAIGLTALTGVVLASAAFRLRLYQEAYGWTELRLYVLATIAVLAIGMVGLVAGLVTDRVRWLGHHLIVATLAVGLALNVVGPVRFITEQNVARVLHPELVAEHGTPGLDERYVLSLGDDAVPALVRALPDIPIPQRTYLARELSYRLEVLSADEGLTAWQAWNAGRQEARAALESARSRGVIP